MQYSNLKVLCIMVFLLSTTCGIVRAQVGPEDTVELRLLPLAAPANGDFPGTKGWGYTLKNNSPRYWYVGYEVEFQNTSSPEESESVSPAPFDYPIVPPGGAVSVPYDGKAGLAELVVDPVSASPQGVTGTFTLRANWYDGNPFEGGKYVSPAATAAVSLTTSRKCGDANLDSKLDINDTVKVLRSIVGLEELTPEQFRAADTNSDATININDAVKILRILVELDPPCA